MTERPLVKDQASCLGTRATAVLDAAKIVLCLLVMHRPNRMSQVHYLRPTEKLGGETTHEQAFGWVPLRSSTQRRMKLIEHLRSGGRPTHRAVDETSSHQLIQLALRSPMILTHQQILTDSSGAVQGARNERTSTG